MRISIGLGLTAAVTLFACTVTLDETGEPAASHGVADDERGADDGDDESVVDPIGTAPPQGSDSEDPADTETSSNRVLSGIAIREVAVFQGVKVSVAQDGSPVAAETRNAPVVAGRPGTVRVYVAPHAGWTARDVTAELRLVGDDAKALPIVRETKRISGDSKEEDPASTFNLDVPADSLLPGVTFQVALTGDGADAVTGDSDGRYPRSGALEDLGVERSGKVKVVVVPFKYDADGSGRLPELGKAQLDLYAKKLMAWYPAADVEITTRAPVAWSSRIARNGSGFQDVLRSVLQLRQDDKVAKDVYYYGLFAPTATFATYCSGGCVTGLSTVVDKNSPAMRASVGIGFTGVQSAETMAHELGHAHGREHAPCGGAQGVDAKFPYKDGSIGVWGYDIFKKVFVPASKGRDMMGYCPNQWVSDYTYRALFDRISTVNTPMAAGFAPSASRAPNANRSFRIATVDASGALAWNGDVHFDDGLVGGAVHEATFLTEDGDEATTDEARFFRFDHLPGGFLFVPAHKSVAWKTVAVKGFAHTLAR